MLDIDIGQTLRLDIQDLIGQRVAVLGISGSGKTNTVATLAEELLPHLAMTIIDIEGEYFGLKERYSLIVAGRSEHSEVPLFTENAASIAEMSIRRGISVILDFSEYDQDEMQDILLAYCQRLWQLSTSLKSPYEIIIEEAHEFVPQGTRTPLKTLLTRFALRGRKRGIGVILASQRSAKVDKDLLTQANILFLQNVVHPVDLSVYKDLIPLPAKLVEQQARELAPGEAFAVRGKMVDRVSIRKRHTFHAGATPTLGIALPHLKSIDPALLEDLRKLANRSIKADDEVSRLRKQLQEANTKITELETLLKRKDEHIELLSRLSVHAEPTPSTLEINKATVHHMHLPVAQHVSQQPVVEGTIAQKAIEAPINEAKVKSLQRRLSQMSARQTQIFKLLVARESDKALSINEIAAWLGIDRSTVDRNMPPEALFKIGLLRKIPSGHGWLYKATISDHITKEFPHADTHEIMKRVLA